MRRFMGFLLIIASIALIASIFVFSVETVLLNEKYFSNVFLVEGRARELKVNHSDLMRVNKSLLDYIKGKDVDLSQEKIKVNGNEQRAFDSTEVHHMVDVKGLYANAKTIRLIGIGAAGLIMALVIISIKKDRLELFAKSYRNAFILIFAIVLGLGAWIAIDFDSFWNSLHYLVFSDLSWQLDPAKNFMIRMYPSDFWFDACKLIAVRFAIATGVIFVASFIYEKFKRYKRNKLLTLDVDSDESSVYNYETQNNNENSTSSYVRSEIDDYYDEYDPV